MEDNFFVNAWFIILSFSFLQACAWRHTPCFAQCILGPWCSQPEPLQARTMGFPPKAGCLPSPITCPSARRAPGGITRVLIGGFMRPTARSRGLCRQGHGITTQGGLLTQLRYMPVGACRLPAAGTFVHRPWDNRPRRAAHPALLYARRRMPTAGRPPTGLLYHRFSGLA